MRMDLGLDLGSFSARMVTPGSSVPLTEASLAMVRGEKTCLLGEAAYRALGRTPQGMRPVWPIVHGAVEDLAVCVELIRSMMDRVVSSAMPVSYTHLDVYKRQSTNNVGTENAIPVSG